jgi:ribosomal protein L11 methyltransferase
MTMGTLAVIAAADVALPAAEAAVMSQGAKGLESRGVVGNRTLVYGRFADEEHARCAVVELRRQGWAAAQRPTDDDPQIVAWRNRTQAVSVGDGRLMVALPWAELDSASAPVLSIDPGGAFGGGSHPTTRLLLEMLAARVRGGETVLDVGCGSGVLALAALRLGAAVAVGTDIEPAAVAAMEANAERNGLAHKVTALATPLQELDGGFDVVLANIGQDVLISLAPDIERLLAPGGWLGLSGISPAQVSHVSAAYPSLQVMAVPELDDWAAIRAARSRLRT